jgi:hypothetical protein
VMDAAVAAGADEVAAGADEVAPLTRVSLGRSLPIMLPRQLAPCPSGPSLGVNREGNKVRDRFGVLALLWEKWLLFHCLNTH